MSKKYFAQDLVKLLMVGALIWLAISTDVMAAIDYELNKQEAIGHQYSTQIQQKNLNR